MTKVVDPVEALRTRVAELRTSRASLLATQVAHPEQARSRSEVSASLDAAVEDAAAAALAALQAATAAAKNGGSVDIAPALALLALRDRTAIRVTLHTYLKDVPEHTASQRAERLASIDQEIASRVAAERNRRLKGVDPDLTPEGLAKRTALIDAEIAILTA
jgi:hypothetical protein